MPLVLHTTPRRVSQQRDISDIGHARHGLTTPQKAASVPPLQSGTATSLPRHASPLSAAMSRPMTSRQAHRAYLNSTRGPRLSKAEERRMEREEQERIRRELKQQQAQARAQAAKERKRAKEEEARREKKRRGEPICPVTASQGMISGFLKKTGGSSKGSTGGVVDENTRNTGGAVSKAPAGGFADNDTRNVGREMPDGPKGRVGSEDDRDTSSAVAGIAKHSSSNCGARNEGKPASARFCGEGKQADGKHPGFPSLSASKEPDNTAKGERRTDANSGVDAGFGGAAKENAKTLGGLALGASKTPSARAGDADNDDAKPEGDTSVGEAGQEDGKDLDDLFLSASQLAREVEDMPPPPTRKRSYDAAFSLPEPPSEHGDHTKGDPHLDTANEPYDLGISSQELLQLEAAEGPARERPPSQEPPRPDAGRTRPGSPSPDVSFSDSFDLCSQELRYIDALIAGVPQQTKHPTTDTDTNPAANPDEQDTEGRTPDAVTGEDPNAQRRSAAHESASRNANACGGDTEEAPGENAEPEEPQRFFTSGTQELVSLAEMRSRATADAEARRRRSALESYSKPRHSGCGEAGGERPGDTVPTPAGKAGHRPDEPKSPHEPAGTAQALPAQSRSERKLRRASSINLDDDAWWEDLENTDLETLLAGP